MGVICLAYQLKTPRKKKENISKVQFHLISHIFVIFVQINSVKSILHGRYGPLILHECGILIVSEQNSKPAYKT